MIGRPDTSEWGTREDAPGRPWQRRPAPTTSRPPVARLAARLTAWWRRLQDEAVAAFHADPVAQIRWAVWYAGYLAVVCHLYGIALILLVEWLLT